MRMIYMPAQAAVLIPPGLASVLQDASFAAPPAFVR